jgi:hypothetical protein
MSFSATPTYSELQAAVKNWLKRGTELDSYLADIILAGEKRIFRKLRVRAMEEALSSTISSGTIALPTGYVDLKFAYIDGSPVQNLQRKSADWMYLNYPTRASDGKPKFIAREGTNFIFGPYPDSGYTVKGVYYKRLTAVASSANTLFTDNPDLYLFAALAESSLFLGQDDNRPKIWEAKFNEILRDVQNEDSDEGTSGGVLSMTAS